MLATCRWSPVKRISRPPKDANTFSQSDSSKSRKHKTRRERKTQERDGHKCEGGESALHVRALRAKAKHGNRRERNTTLEQRLHGQLCCPEAYSTRATRDKGLSDPAPGRSAGTVRGGSDTLLLFPRTSTSLVTLKNPSRRAVPSGSVSREPRHRRTCVTLGMTAT